jgi:hypothetical protein
MNIEKQQEALLALMKNEKLNDLSFYHSVWFQPSSGRFLFADKYTRYEILEPLIENKTLVFKGIEYHQGEYMLRYTLH